MIARRAQTCDRRRITRRDVSLEDARAESRPQADGLYRVLDRDGHAGERPRVFATRERRLQSVRALDGVRRQRDDRVQTRIQLLHASQVRFHNLDGRNRARAHERGELHGGKSCQLSVRGHLQRAGHFASRELLPLCANADERHFRRTFLPASSHVGHVFGELRASGTVVSLQTADELERGVPRSVAAVDDADRARPLRLGQRDDGEVSILLRARDARTRDDGATQADLDGALDRLDVVELGRAAHADAVRAQNLVRRPPRRDVALEEDKVLILQVGGARTLPFSERVRGRADEDERSPLSGTTETPRFSGWRHAQSTAPLKTSRTMRVVRLYSRSILACG